MRTSRWRLARAIGRKIPARRRRIVVDAASFEGVSSRGTRPRRATTTRRDDARRRRRARCVSTSSARRLRARRVRVDSYPSRLPRSPRRTSHRATAPSSSPRRRRRVAATARPTRRPRASLRPDPSIPPCRRSGNASSICTTRARVRIPTRSRGVPRTPATRPPVARGRGDPRRDPPPTSRSTPSRCACDASSDPRPLGGN